MGTLPLPWEPTAWPCSERLIPYLNQAARLAEAGYASVDDIDRAMMLGAGPPHGPVRP